MLPNEFMEALCRVRVPGEAMQVFQFILRKTWGWGKDEDEISLSQFFLATGLKKVTVIKARKKLEEMNLITVTKLGNEDSVKYRINKDVTCWKPLPKKVTLPNLVTNVTQLGNKSLPNWVPTKDNSTKYKKDIVADESPSEKPRQPKPKKQKPEYSAEVLELTELLISQILKAHPTGRISKPESLQDARDKWPGEIERLIRLDGRAPPEIREVILWATEDSFWSSNILSAAKLRDKWDTLKAQKGRTKKTEIVSKPAPAEKPPIVILHEKLEHGHLSAEEMPVTLEEAKKLWEQTPSQPLIPPIQAHQLVRDLAAGKSL